jgi:hypothetical protein
LRAPDSDLSLSRLATLLATPARRLSRVCAFARDARDWRGAALLNALQRAATAVVGDRELSATFDFLLHHSSRPYLAMLHDWIYFGKLRRSVRRVSRRRCRADVSGAPAAGRCAGGRCGDAERRRQRGERKVVASLCRGAASTVAVPWFFEWPTASACS